MKINVNDITLDVSVDGPGDAPVMIAHHGGPGIGSAVQVRPQFMPFSAVARVVTYDARGSGSSPLVPPYTHRQWAADVDAVRAGLGVDKIIMCGHSYGGFIALEYALRYPGRVSGLILEDTAAQSGGLSSVAIDNALASSRVNIDQGTLERVMSGQCRDDEDLKTCFLAMLPLYDYQPRAEATSQALEECAFHADTHNWAFSRNQPEYDVVHQLSSIKCPTLVLVGRHDWITPVEAAEEIANGIPGAQLVVFEKSGHAPGVEEAARFQDAVRSFLADHDLV